MCTGESGNNVRRVELNGSSLKKYRPQTQTQQTRLSSVRQASSLHSDTEEISDWETSSECEANSNDSGYAEQFEENDQVLSSDSWSVQYHSSSTSRRAARTTKPSISFRHSTQECDTDSSRRSNSRIRCHEGQGLDDGIPLAIKLRACEHNSGQQHEGSVYGNLFAKPDPWKRIGIILGLEGPNIQDKKATVDQCTASDVGSTVDLEKSDNAPVSKQSDEGYETSCDVQSDVFFDEDAIPRSNTTKNASCDFGRHQHDLGLQTHRILQHRSSSCLDSIDFFERIIGNPKYLRDAAYSAGFNSNGRSEDPGPDSECTTAIRDYIHGITHMDEMDYRSEVLAVPGLQEVDGRFLAPSIFDNCFLEQE